MKKLLAFDLEVAEVLPAGQDFAYKPGLGISIGVTLTSSGTRILWYSHDEAGLPAPRMRPEECWDLTKYLMEMQEHGWTILTWNGLAFDFRLLADETGLQDACIELAMNHVDIMFQLFCYKGYRLGLETAAKGLHVEGKSRDTTGAEAPILWQAREFGRVMRYVTQDSAALLNVAEALLTRGGIPWISKSGIANFCPFRHGLLTVKQCLELPLPDTSWMDNPPPRESFIGWMEEENEGDILQCR